jgi:hypothetical protein
MYFYTSQMSLTIESFSQEFKRAGNFDDHRKRILKEFTESSQGQKLIDKLRSVAANSNASSQPQIISILSKQDNYIEAEREINIYFLGNSAFKEKVKEELKLLWQNKYGLKRKESISESLDSFEDHSESHYRETSPKRTKFQ